LSLLVKEIYPAIIGEGIYSGFSGLIIRLTGCNLNCAYCDTRYARSGGRWWQVGNLLKLVEEKDFEKILITGGEPLLQPEVIEFIQTLLKRKKQVLLETNGSLSLKKVPQKTHIIMDLKTPGSGEEASNCYENLNFLKPSDEVKIVLTDYKDYLWAKKVIQEKKLEKRFLVSLSPAWGMLAPEKLARWLLKDRLKVRLNLQIHKFIFPGRERRI